jgi:hypothetical protein
MSSEPTINQFSSVEDKIIVAKNKKEAADNAFRSGDYTQGRSIIPLTVVRNLTTHITGIPRHIFQIALTQYHSVRKRAARTRHPKLIAEITRFLVGALPSSGTRQERSTVCDSLAS